MKYLGIDFGSKRIGLSISDDNGRMAFPHSVVLNNKDLLFTIEKIIKDERVDEIVMGESTNFKGEPNEIMKEIEKFKKVLEEKFGLEIIFEPEFMTSVQAERGISSRRLDTKNNKRTKERQEPKSELLDASAATIILQSYLDKKIV